MKVSNSPPKKTTKLLGSSFYLFNIIKKVKETLDNKPNTLLLDKKLVISKTFFIY